MWYSLYWVIKVVGKKVESVLLMVSVWYYCSDVIFFIVVFIGVGKLLYLVDCLVLL